MDIIKNIYTNKLYIFTYLNKNYKNIIDIDKLILSVLNNLLIKNREKSIDILKKIIYSSIGSELISNNDIIYSDNGYVFCRNCLNLDVQEYLNYTDEIKEDDNNNEFEYICVYCKSIQISYYYDMNYPCTKQICNINNTEYNYIYDNMLSFIDLKIYLSFMLNNNNYDLYKKYFKILLYVIAMNDNKNFIQIMKKIMNKSNIQYYYRLYDNTNVWIYCEKCEILGTNHEMTRDHCDHKICSDCSRLFFGSSLCRICKYYIPECCEVRYCDRCNGNLCTKCTKNFDIEPLYSYGKKIYKCKSCISKKYYDDYY